MTSNINRDQCHNIIHDMIEQVGIYKLFDEMICQMSTDQLNDMVNGLNQYMFDNHYAQHFVD